MKIGIMGSGEVGQSLGEGFLKYGHEVTLGTRDPSKLADWLKANPKGHIDSVAAAAKFGEAIVLAVKGAAASATLAAAGAANLAGKIVMDATNPTTDEPPVNGVFRFFTDVNHSLMEQLQEQVPAARLVKVFSSVGAALMVDPKLKGGKPTMFICGNDAAAKKTVTGILDQFGWETADMGKAEAARAIEPLCILWCIPGFLNNDWTHAFKVLRP
jgi:8-hydroxy-5-deazaflavin:NADPH oxidoreductase